MQADVAEAVKQALHKRQAAISKAASPVPQPEGTLVPPNTVTIDRSNTAEPVLGEGRASSSITHTPQLTERRVTATKPASRTDRQMSHCHKASIKDRQTDKSLPQGQQQGHTDRRITATGPAPRTDSMASSMTHTSQVADSNGTFAGMACQTMMAQGPAALSSMCNAWSAELGQAVSTIRENGAVQMSQDKPSNTDAQTQALLGAPSSPTQCVARRSAVAETSSQHAASPLQSTRRAETYSEPLRSPERSLLMQGDNVRQKLHVPVAASRPAGPREQAAAVSQEMGTVEVGAGATTGVCATHVGIAGVSAGKAGTACTAGTAGSAGTAGAADTTSPADTGSAAGTSAAPPGAVETTKSVAKHVRPQLWQVQCILVQCRYSSVELSSAGVPSCAPSEPL